MIDIIIITKNNFAEFVETINSIKSEIEYINKIIIVDDSDENYIDEVLKIINQKEKIIYIHQKAKSIYNAFNVGISYVSANYIFLNSGDVLISGSFQNIHGPAVLPVLGIHKKNIKRVIKQNDFLFWFCHQSIVFDKNFKQNFNENYKISADLDFYIRYVKEFDVPKKHTIQAGLIGYDLSGISSSNKFLRDKEYLIIYYQHKLYLQLGIFFVLMIIKLMMGRYV